MFVRKMALNYVPSYCLMLHVDAGSSDYYACDQKQSYRVCPSLKTHISGSSSLYCPAPSSELRHSWACKLSFLSMNSGSLICGSIGVAASGTYDIAYSACKDGAGPLRKR